MRILLISVNRESAPYPVAPLGLACVGGAARRAGHGVSLVDLCFAHDPDAAVAQAVAQCRPDLVGLSIRNVDNLTFPASASYLPGIAAAVAAVRGATNAPIVAGGPGFSIFPSELMRRLDLEFGVVGEGEAALRALANALEEGRDPLGIPNLLRRADPPSALVRRQEAFEGAPARELLDNRAYLDLGGMANIQTKRGCPFDCAYCTYPQIDGPRLRLRPAEEVVEELEGMVAQGLSDVFFVDDIFNWPHDHALAICERIVARGVQLRWTCFASPSGMTPALAAAMHRAGCRGVEFGADTASPSVLRALGKPFPQEELRAAARACREAGLPTAYYLIFGGPGETADTIAETVTVLDELQPDAVLAFLGIRIYPGTPLRQIAIRDGVISAGDDLLQPRFYISPAVGPAQLQARVADYAAARPNWVVPGLGIRSDPALLGALRRAGHRGPLWDLLGARSGARGS